METIKKNVLMILRFNFVICLILICGCDNNIKKNKHNELSGNSLQDSVYLNLYKNVNNPIFNYEEALINAKKSKKKMLVVFSSIACVSCRKFENKVLFNSKIKTLMGKNLISVFLFADDKRKFITGEKIFSRITKKEIKTIGDYNIDIQALKVRSGSIPDIYIFNDNGEVLSHFDLQFKVNEFEKWIKNNLDK